MKTVLGIFLLGALSFLPVEAEEWECVGSGDRTFCVGSVVISPQGMEGWITEFLAEGKARVAYPGFLNPQLAILSELAVTTQGVCSGEKDEGHCIGSVVTTPEDKMGVIVGVFSDGHVAVEVSVKIYDPEIERWPAQDLVVLETALE